MMKKKRTLLMLLFSLLSVSMLHPLKQVYDIYYCFPTYIHVPFPIIHC